MDEPVWCHTPGTPAIRQLGQEDHEFKASLGNMVRPSNKQNYPVLLSQLQMMGPRINTLAKESQLG